MNNGFTSGPFSLSRGVRQGIGRLLSPYLFILALEILAIKKRNDNSIQGILLTPIRTLRAFGGFSVLQVNKDKTEALALGSSGSVCEGHLVMNNLCLVVTLKREKN